MSIERTNEEKTLNGICHFFSETGSEGGYWAFQDERFMNIRSDVEDCKGCNRIGYVPEGQSGGGRAHDSRTDLEQQQKWILDWEAEREEMERQSAEMIKQFGFSFSFKRPCEPGAHDWKVMHPEGTWSYEGLHLLEDGDQLTILSKEKNVADRRTVWSGTIELQQYPLFTEDAKGLWIHADQKGVSRDRWSQWFFDQFPARLTPRQG